MKQDNDSEQNYLNELRNFIDNSLDPREQKRGIAVRMWIEGIPPAKIQIILNVTATYISRYKIRFAEHGVEGLELGYKGAKAYLSTEERIEIIKYLDTKNDFNLRNLKEYIEDEYDVRFKSNQSYYEIFHESKISWKKTQKKNPKRNDELVKAKKLEIEKILEDNREDIEAGKLIVYMIDECHLLWGDVCGYVWGKTSERIEVPMTNEKERQTFFGALNYKTKQFFVHAYGKGNSENTVLFLKYLQDLNLGTRTLIFWDGASYHKYAEMRDYLGEVNQGVEKSKWQIICELFAPNAPEQNPVEDIWLQGKRFLREHWHLCKTFPIVKRLFVLVTHCQSFDFPKLDMYGSFANIPELMPAQ